MRPRHSIEYVREYIAENSDSVLLSDVYKNNRSPLKMRCSCGNEFTARFDNFRSQVGSRMCSKCYARTKPQCTPTPELEISKFISDNSGSIYVRGYTSAHRKMWLRCVCGNEFETTLLNFKLGKRKCDGCRTPPHNRHTEVKIKRLIREESECEYVSGWVVSTKPFRVRCVCGQEFETLLSNFRAGKKQCDTCSRRQSSGERRVEAWLVTNGVEYQTQKRFKGCKDKRSLPFDFYLPKYNTCIEYDGQQHFRDHAAFGWKDSFPKISYRDSIKTVFCEDKGIRLLRIPYTQFENIECILHNHVNTEVSI